MANYEQMVVALMSPDNVLRNQAEAAFNQEKGNPDVMIRSLVHLLTTNQNQQVCTDGHLQVALFVALQELPLAPVAS